MPFNVKVEFRDFGKIMSFGPFSDSNIAESAILKLAGRLDVMSATCVECEAKAIEKNTLSRLAKSAVNNLNLGKNNEEPA